MVRGYHMAVLVGHYEKGCAVKDEEPLSEEEQAWLSGDFENESKMDVLNIEAWLDKEG